MRSFIQFQEHKNHIKKLVIVCVIQKLIYSSLIKRHTNPYKVRVRLVMKIFIDFENFVKYICLKHSRTSKTI